MLWEAAARGVEELGTLSFQGAFSQDQYGETCRQEKEDPSPKGGGRCTEDRSERRESVWWHQAKQEARGIQRAPQRANSEPRR